MNLLFSLILICKGIQKNNAFIAKIRKSQNQLFKAFLKLETESKSSWQMEQEFLLNPSPQLLQVENCSFKTIFD